MLRRARPLLGTFVEVRVSGASSTMCGGQLAHQAIDAAFDTIEHVDRLMSFHRADSDLGRLHAARPGTAVAVHPWTMRVLREASRLHRLTSGPFDPSVANELVAHGVLPAPAGPAPDHRATFADIVLLRDNAVIRQRAVWLDLGGIAKGFAVDAAVLAMRRTGVRAGTVSAGGDLRVFGRDAQPVSVRSPAHPAAARSLGMLRTGAVATSGNYFAESFGLPRATDAIVAPSGQRQRGRYASVSVLAPRCIWADALTKIVMLAGLESPMVHQALSTCCAQAIVS